MRKAENLPPYCAIVKKSRGLNFLDPSGPTWPVTGVLYLYLLLCRLDRGSVVGRASSLRAGRTEFPIPVEADFLQTFLDLPCVPHNLHCMDTGARRPEIEAD